MSNLICEGIMNYFIKALVAVIILFFNPSFCANPGSTYQAGDDFIVNSIKKVSDLTQADVDKWKLLWLSRAAEPVAALTGLYAVSTVGEAAAQAHTDYGNDVKNVLKGELLPQFMRLPGVVQSVASSKELWVGAGVAGVGYAAYKFLYPRVTLGIRNNVIAFNDLCSQLGICTKSYANIDQLKSDAGSLASVAMTDTSSKGDMARKNHVWSDGSAIAMQKGLINLKMQRYVAVQLLNQLEPSAENQKLSAALNNYRAHLDNNERAIQPAIAAEKHKRTQEQGEYMAGLRVQSAQAGLTSQYIKNTQNVWRTLKDIAEFGVRHKEGIAKIGVAIGGTLVYKKLTRN